jgi:hypothetical protein
VLKDFGGQEDEARAALRLIRDLNLTQHGTIGGPQPVLEFWLSQGKAPEGLLTRSPTTAFNPKSLRLEQVYGQWCLRDDQRVLFVFGTQADAAREALEVIRRYEFNHVGYLGHPIPTMMYFLSRRQDRAHGPQTGEPPSNRPGEGENALAGTLHHLAGFVSGAPAPRPSVATVGQPGLSKDDRTWVSLVNARQLTRVSLDGSPTGEERVPFDWREVHVRYSPPHWQLVVGAHVLADLGANEQPAREALRVLQDYRFTEQLLVGGPAPTFSYFLTNGRPPRDVAFGIHSVAFRPEALTVCRLETGWAVCEGTRRVLSFGDREEDARQACRVIQHHRCDHLCWVGDLVPGGMTILVRSRE